MKRIRIVFGVNDFLVGGMQRQFAEQLKFYDRTKFDIHLITLFHFPGKPTLYDALPPDLPVHRLRFRGFIDLESWLQLYRLLRDLKPDIVVSSLFFGNTVFRVLKPLVGYVSIAREHNTYVDKPLFQRLVDRMLSRVSYVIVAVSNTVAEFTSLQEGISRERFFVIHNGIDVQEMRDRLQRLPPRSALCREFDLRSEDRVFVNVARLTAQKNHRLLIDGFALFHAAHPGYKLAIVGDGSLRAKLEAHASDAGVARAVIFFGHRDDVWKFYKLAEAFVSASDIEGFSNAYLEALAAGVPLIATRTAGTDEILEDGVNGFSIGRASPEGVAEALNAFDAAAAERLRAGAVGSAERFDIRTTVGAYAALFERSIAQR